MTDVNKYKSVAVDYGCYDKIDKLAKLLAPGITLSKAQVVRMLVDEKSKYFVIEKALQVETRDDEIVKPTNYLVRNEYNN